MLQSDDYHKAFYAKKRREAHRLALEHVNKERADKGLPPVKRLEALWWSINWRKWMQDPRVKAIKKPPPPVYRLKPDPTHSRPTPPEE